MNTRTPSEHSFISHLIEIRDRLLKVVVFILVLFLAMASYANEIYSILAGPLLKQERRMIFPLLIASTFLFYLGITFAYFVVFPLVFGFLTTAAPEGVAVMTDIAKYLDFVLGLFFAFGVCFEVPIFTIVLVWTGLISTASLAEKRPYVIVGAFVVGAVLTPPDAISQTLLAIPIWMLFEVGLLCTRFFKIETKDNYPVEVGSLD